VLRCINGRRVDKVNLNSFFLYFNKKKSAKNLVFLKKKKKVSIIINCTRSPGIKTLYGTFDKIPFTKTPYVFKKKNTSDLNKKS
jgi:hypothetical protein